MEQHKGNEVKDGNGRMVKEKEAVKKEGCVDQIFNFWICWKMLVENQRDLQKLAKESGTVCFFQK